MQSLMVNGFGVHLYKLFVLRQIHRCQSCPGTDFFQGTFHIYAAPATRALVFDLISLPVANGYALNTVYGANPSPFDIGSVTKTNMSPPAYRNK